MTDTRTPNARVQAFMRKYGATILPVPVLIQMQQTTPLPWTRTKVVASVALFLQSISSIEADLSLVSPHWKSGKFIFEGDLNGRPPYPYITHDFLNHVFSGVNTSVRTMILTAVYLKTIADVYGSLGCLGVKRQCVFAGAMMIAMKHSGEALFSLEHYSNLFHMNPGFLTRCERAVLGCLRGKFVVNTELYKAYEITLFNGAKSIDNTHEQTN